MSTYLHIMTKGPLTVMTPVTAVAGILTYVWPFAHSVGGYTAIAAIYGYASSQFVPG